MAHVKQYNVDAPYLNVQCRLGEAPHYSEKLNEFRFLDIDNKQIHFIDVAKGTSSHWVLDHPGFSIGVTADIEGQDDEFVFAGEDLYGVMNKHTGKFRVLKNLWGAGPEAESNRKQFRMNDGNVDPQGRFWGGTMLDPIKITDWIQPKGTLYRLDSDLSLHSVLEGVTIPNGMSWTNDNRTMYWTDSGSMSIYAFDYEGSTGEITNKREFYKLPPGKTVAAPDGHAMDVEEHLWVAIFGRGQVLRINPKGEVVAEVKLPAMKITCPCFVGEELWITSCGAGDDQGQCGGALFKVNVGVKGKPKNQWGATIEPTS